ncbi:MAG: hypothetical protein M1825_004826 [Sarcosagium campestre]|nr:MAG: hypothetical protein M1825_004826 [Sarcosagium campestre]
MASKRPRAAFEADLQSQQSPYVIYGTALPPIDPDVRDDGSYVPLWKQEVTDERGRKRLHGAFTGGFSAGYFNTVGSKEGWAPSTFVSSRSKRKKDGEIPTQQRAEDFMDEEDLADAAEAQRLETSSSFAGLGSTETDGTRQSSLIDVFKSAGDTMGIKLLRRMGWKDGQGIGSKVRRKARDDDERGQGNTEDAGGEMHMFAPENTSMIVLNGKYDQMGLGYAAKSSLLSLSANGDRGEDNDDDDENGISSVSSSLARSKIKKPKPARSGFGVGVLNDDGSDDEDPYTMGPRISYTKTIQGDKKKKKKSREDQGFATLSAANPLVGAKPVFIPKKLASAKGSSGFRKCHDGRLPLDGFILASPSISLAADSDLATHETPPIPDGWRSSKTSLDAPNADGNYRSTADAAKASTLDPKSRANILGESLLPSKSVFDFLTPSARDRVAAAAGNPNLPAGLNEAVPQAFAATESEKEKDLWSLVPRLDKEIATKALGRGIGGWMPYAEDEEKRRRYREFLEVNAGLRSNLPTRQPGVKVDDWVKELQEFAHAAQIFKPMTGMMASRFTSAKASPQLASDRPDSDPAPGGTGAPDKRPDDPAEAAAKLGLYGPMTRSSHTFFPTRLLCKRFNVRPPSHVQANPDAPSSVAASASGAGEMNGARSQSSSAIPSKSLELVSKDALNDMLKESVTKDAGLGGPSGSEDRSRARIVIDAEQNESLEKERPGEAVFKAIFGSDDEDGDN